MSVNSKPRLSISEMKELIQYLKQQGSYSTFYSNNNNQYTIDDILEQYIQLMDVSFGLMDEVLLKKGR